MDQNSCIFYDNMVTYAKNPHCSFDTFDYAFSDSQPFSDNTSNSAQLGTNCKLPSFDVFSDFRVSYPQTDGNAIFRSSSENIESWQRPENNVRDTFNISPIVIESTGVDEQKQRQSENSNLLHATGPEDDGMSWREKKWQSLNNDKRNFMGYPGCDIRTDHSVNNIISGVGNLVVNPDFPTGSNESVNGREHASEYVIDGHNSIEMHCNLSNVSEKTATNVKQLISSKTDYAVAGPSEMCPRKKKFPCPLCPMEFNKKSHLASHYRIHTNEKPFVCKICKKAFSQKGNLNTHIKTHSGETPYKCPVCRT